MKRLLIRSAARLDKANTSTDDFKIKLSEPLFGKYLIKSCMLNNSIYTINDNNNKLYFSDTSGTYTATLTNGSHNSTTLLTEIQTQLNAESSQAYTVTYDDITNKYTIACDVNCQILFDTNPQSSYPNCGTVIGFSDTDTTAATSVTGDLMANFSPLLSLAISLEGNCYSNYNTNDRTHCNIYIPLNESFGFYQIIDKTKFSQYLQFDYKQNVISVKIMGTDNNEVDLNGIEWEMLIEKID